MYFVYSIPVMCRFTCLYLNLVGISWAFKKSPSSAKRMQEAES